MTTKQCRWCKNVFPLDTFPVHSEMKDGHLNKCRSCYTAANAERYQRNKPASREKQREYAKKNAERIAAAHHDRYVKDRERRLKKMKEYRDNPANAKRLKAHRRQYYIDNKERFSERRQAYSQTDRGRVVMNSAHKKERVIHAHKIKARTAVSNAIRDGRMTKLTTCSGCGSVGEIEAHHHKGYDREHWLDVVWLCVPCHKAADAKQAA